MQEKISIVHCRIEGCGGIASKASSMCHRHILIGRDVLHRIIRSREAVKRVRWRKLYAIKVCDYVKIGIADDVAIRMKGMQIGCPFKMELLGFIDAQEFVEFTIHEHLVDESAHGEWFHLRGRVLEVVEAICQKDFPRLATMISVPLACIGVPVEQKNLNTPELLDEVEKNLNYQMAVERRWAVQ